MCLFSTLLKNSVETEEEIDDLMMFEEEEGESDD